jgi:hypothetical protein
MPAPSNVKLFVTNLRLLDLDLRRDWPGITVQTFSSKNADQKQRIGGVEWALYRLFELWDPDETSQARIELDKIKFVCLTICAETAALLSAPRTTPVTQSTRRPIQKSE